MTSESLPIAASAEHLTDVFRRAGLLEDGSVCDVVVESSRNTILSRIMRLRLSYQGASNAPKSVILKTELPERAGGTWNAGRQEVKFYSQVAAAMSACLVPRCFEASWDPNTKGWHILLEDLSESHVLATQWPLPPTMEQCRTILRAHAQFQAAWWDHPRLGVSVGNWLNTEAMDRQMQNFAEKFARFTDRIGDRLPLERRDLFERLLDSAPGLFARYSTHRNLTIVQGDAHVWNCFLPRDAGSEDARLFDWDSWRIATGSNDLAYMMAVHWYPDLRRERERPLLDHYHATLVAQGVRGYDRRALDDDYRLSVLWQITTPVWQEAYNIPPWIWWNNLERILLAVDDLDCRDLLR
jgi:hypothetical protein